MENEPCEDVFPSWKWAYSIATVDGSEILHHLRLVVYPVIYEGLYTSQVVGLGISEPSTVF